LSPGEYSRSVNLTKQVFPSLLPYSLRWKMVHGVRQVAEVDFVRGQFIKSFLNVISSHSRLRSIDTQTQVDVAARKSLTSRRGKIPSIKISRAVACVNTLPSADVSASRTKKRGHTQSQKTWSH